MTGRRKHLPVEIDPLVLQMLEWELHRVRTELQIVELRVQFYAHDHPSAHTLLNQIRAARELLQIEQIVRLREGVDPEQQPHSVVNLVAEQLPEGLPG